MGTEPISSSGHPFPLTLRVNAEGRRKNAERGMAPVQPAVFILHFQLGAPIPPHPTLSPEEREKYPPRYDPLWRRDIPSGGSGTLSFGERAG